MQGTGLPTHLDSTHRLVGGHGRTHHACTLGSPWGSETVRRAPGGVVLTPGSAWTELRDGFMTAWCLIAVAHSEGRPWPQMGPQAPRWAGTARTTLASTRGSVLHP